MKNFILLITFAILFLIVVIWHYSDRNSHAAKAREEFQNAAAQTGEFVREKLGSSNFNTDDLRDELARTGKIVRQKAQDATAAVVDATADARITATIKAKLLADSELSGFSISVTTTDRNVTLGGTASSVDNIRKAMKIALDTEGVHVVVSKVQLKK